MSYDLRVRDPQFVATDVTFEATRVNNKSVAKMKVNILEIQPQGKFPVSDFSS